MAGPASVRTVESKMGFETAGKGALESRGVVMRDPSRTGRMGEAVPVEASMFTASLNRFDCAEIISSRDREDRHAVSLG